MTEDIPRISHIAVDGPASLTVTWVDGSETPVNLAGWIGTGGDILKPLADAGLFARARLGEHGSAVAWDDDDLMIDAAHLELLAEEQRPFRGNDAEGWQRLVGLSNREAADFFGVAVSTWHAYKAQADIPEVIGMLCRASLRDPLLLQAHYRPRLAGRPRRRNS